ncbi:unnamed protein product, partial [Closterium sp. NIES-53]
MTLCLLSVLLLLLVITVEYGDDDDDDGGDTRSSRTRITGSYDDLDDVTRGSGGLDDFWGLGQQGQGRYCRERGQLAVCRPPDAVIIAEGDLGSRLSSVCSAAALLPAANLTTLALWVPDAFMPHIRFSDLFTLAAAAAAASGNPAPPPDVEGRALRAVAGEGGEGLSSGGREESRGGTDLGNVTEGGTGANSSSSGGRGGSGGSSSSGGDGGGSKGSGAGRFVWVEEANETAAHWRQFLALTHRPVTIRGCQKRGASQDAAVASLTLSLYLSPASINWLVDAVNPCAFERRMTACMAALHPSPPVAELLLQEDVGRLKSALGLYLD